MVTRVSDKEIAGPVTRDLTGAELSGGEAAREASERDGWGSTLTVVHRNSAEFPVVVNMARVVS